MNRIEGVVVVGGVRSVVRFRNAHVICENCLGCLEGINLKVSEHSSKIGTCYVCESITCIKTVIR